MKYSILWCACVGLLLLGCGGSDADSQAPLPGIPAESLQSTLNTIADTGEYRSVLRDLTAGLENAGKMEEAAMVQQFPTLNSPLQVKQLARRIAGKLHQEQARSR